MEEENKESDLAAEFRKIEEEHGAALEAKLEQAKSLLREAVNFANEHALPFRSGICFLQNAYIPRSFHDKFGELAAEVDEDDDEDIFEELCGVGSYLINEIGHGWQHSAVC